MRNAIIERAKAIWIASRFWIGYALFFATIVYALRAAPPEFWMLKPVWLLAAACAAAFLFLAQHLQMRVFLAAVGKSDGHLYPALFTARRGVLNCLLPIRAGTMLLLPMLARRYGIHWREFVIFMVFASGTSVLVSVIAGVWLLFGGPGLLAGLIVGAALLVAARRGLESRFSRDLPILTVLATAIFGAIAAGIYCVLRGLGHGVGFTELMHLTVLLNLLALVSITPGNVGVRELVIAAAAPGLALPLPLGILASAVFYIVRVGSYGLLMLSLDIAARHRAGNPG